MTPAMSTIGRSASLTTFVRITIGFAIIYLVLDRSATWTNSLYGEYGALICGLVIVIGLLAERWLFGTTPRHALIALGFGRPSMRGLFAALLPCLVLVALIPAGMTLLNQPIVLRDGWGWIAFGVLLQGGIAEELLWRGYLFRRLRSMYSFWGAAALAMVFMVVQHLLLFWTLPLPIASAALMIALLSSFPLAYLFEIGDNTVWGAALLHWVIQCGLKIVVVPEADLLPIQLGWMAASVIVPYLAFLIRRRI